jgi:uncharacterized membrane protein
MNAFLKEKGGWGQILFVAFLIFLGDLPWLTLMGGQYNAIAKLIQGGEQVRMRPLAGLVVYPALAFLALKTTSLRDAFLTGAAVYAVYDFTVMAIFDKYPIWLAATDTLWGATLFSIVWLIRQRFGL